MDSYTKQIEFDAVIEQGLGGGAFIKVTTEAAEFLGIKHRAKVAAVFDNSDVYRGSVVTMGSSLVIGILKEIRKKISKEIGDTVKVKLMLDTEPRTIQIPEDFREALENNSLLTLFEKMSYTHKKEYIQEIEGAKKAETRTKRIEKSIEIISKGMKK